MTDQSSLVYSTSTGQAPSGPMADVAETTPVLDDVEWPAFCFVCSRVTDHFAEHDDLVAAGLATYDENGSVRLTDAFTPEAARAAREADEIARTSTGLTDALGVEIRTGDIVTVLHHGTPVRLADCGRRGLVVSVNRAGRLTLDSASTFEGPIASGRAVPPALVAVARRDGQPGHEGNAARG